MHADDALDAALHDAVAVLPAGSRSAPLAAERLLRAFATPAEEAAPRREPLSIRARADSPDGREGVAAFLAKRTPIFRSSAR